MLHFLKGPLKGHITEDGRRKKPSTLLGGNQTHELSVTRFLFYLCAITAARLEESKLLSYNDLNFMSRAQHTKQ